MLEQPEPPTALAIGYWLTVAGLVAGTGGMLVTMVWGVGCGTRRDGERAPCCLRLVSFLVFLPVFGAAFAYGAYLFVLAPLQLVGATRGLAA